MDKKSPFPKEARMAELEPKAQVHLSEQNNSWNKLAIKIFQERQSVPNVTSENKPTAESTRHAQDE